ncbi:MAG: VanW family protein [Deltaproteobacteria bacterium]
MIWNKKGYFIIILMLSLTMILSSCSTHSANRKIENDSAAKEGIIEPTGSSLIKPQPGQKEKTVESGQVNVVPWSGQAEFKKAQRDNGTPVLLAAYRTVLRDPLPGEEYNVHLAARLVAGTVVKPDQVFSQNSTIGPYSSWRGFREGPVYIGSQVSKTTGGGVCKMASTLYNVAVLSNLPVIERHAHSMPVPYVPYGQDATVSYGSKDIRFLNDTSGPVLIWAQGIDNILYVGFYGKQKAPQVQWHHEFLQKQPAVKIVRRNDSLPSGRETVVMQGMDGAQVRSWVTITTQGHTLTKRLGVSYYNPMPSIVERSGIPYASNIKE